MVLGGIVLNNRQKVLNKIVKQDLKVSWAAKPLGFRRTRVADKKATKDLDFGELVTYKNLGV